MGTYYLGYNFTKAVVQTAGAVTAATSATDTITKSAHGLAVGDALVFTAIGGGSGISLATTYYVVTVPSSSTFKVSATRGGSPISIGSATPSYQAIIETELEMANQSSYNVQTDTYEWQGGVSGTSQRVRIESLSSVTVTLNLASLVPGAHGTIFGQTAPGVTLPGGLTSAVGYGGGNDTRGVSVGLRLEGSALKVESGVQSTVNFARWFPAGTLTLTSPATQQAGQTFGATGYSFSATKTASSLVGGAIPNAPSGGNFYYDGEI